MKLWKYSGLLLITTGAIHSLIGVILGWDILLDATSDGLWNTVAAPITVLTQHTRAELLWFLMLGFSWIMLGVKLHADIRQYQQPLSKAWGWVLLLQGSFVAFVYPQTGAWLFILQGLIIIFATTKSDFLST